MALTLIFVSLVLVLCVPKMVFDRPEADVSDNLDPQVDVSNVGLSFVTDILFVT